MKLSLSLIWLPMKMQGDDGDDGDESKNECVFGQPLAVLVTRRTHATDAGDGWTGRS